MTANGREVTRVVVAMSGGVDSAVAASLLAEDGYEVIGVTMRLFGADDAAAGRLNRSCCSIEDVEDARAVCRTIGARHYFLNFEREFKRHVVDYFVTEYSNGRTPYPCLACNDRLKFDFLMKRARVLNADIIATGHHARLERDGDRLRLLRGEDPLKDQAYVLYTLTQPQASRLLLPVGGMSKDEVREYARSRGLSVADKLDSQDICFIPDGDYRAFVEPRLENRRPGVIVGPDREILRSHDGIHGFTVGQRRGLGLPGGSGAPLFVTDIDPETGTVTLGHARDLLRRELYASGVNWVSGTPPDGAIRADARVRYRSFDAAAWIEPVADGVIVRFDEPQRAITPGQAVVCYDGDEVLGGGTIERAVAPSVEIAPAGADAAG